MAGQWWIDRMGGAMVGAMNGWIDGVVIGYLEL